MKAEALKSAELDQILSVNAVFWDQAADLVAAGYQVNAYLREGAKGYNVTFSKNNEAKTLVAIDKKSTSAVPAEVEGISLFQIMATHSDVDSFVLPLIPFGEEPKEAKKCVIRMQRPNPKILWTLEIEGKSLKGDRNKPLRIGAFGGVIDTARFATATTAELIISPATRQYFQARLRRSQWVSEELAKKDLNLRTWCLEKGHKYHAFYHVLQRGDDIPDVKNQLARIAKRKVLEMWPKIDWG
ncbi:hypothetical protein QTO30_20905 [Yoonia sp. GPGPB17]|uniref:hypothetical protein n=1 Tax=Yoonia sp. GPGPB17 TaxID=3026147 RepID=UPI0030BCDE3D